MVFEERKEYGRSRGPVATVNMRQKVMALNDSLIFDFYQGSGIRPSIDYERNKHTM